MISSLRNGTAGGAHRARPVASLRWLAVAAALSLSTTARADGRNTMIDFGSGGTSAAYLPGSAAAHAPAQVAQQNVPTPVASTVAPGQAYMPAPAAVSYPQGATAPARQPAIATPVSQYDVAPAGVNGYAVAPTSIEGYSNPPVQTDRRQYAELYAPRPLPPRLGEPVAPPAPVYGQPAPARPVAKAPRRAAPGYPPAKMDEPDRDEQQADDNKDEKDEKPEKPKLFAVDASFGSTTRKAGVGSVGITSAVGGNLDKSGMRFHTAWQVQFGCCVGQFKDTTTYRGTTYSSHVLVGYEWVGEKGTIATYAGVNVENQPVAPIDANLETGTRQTTAGFQAALDLYYTPTDWMMMSTNASFSTRKRAYYARSKLGFAVAEELYVGPEAGASGSTDYNQYRVGAHISGVKIGAMSFGLSGGYAFDRKNGNGGYMILDSRMTF